METKRVKRFLLNKVETALMYLWGKRECILILWDGPPSFISPGPWLYIPCFLGFSYSLYLVLVMSAELNLSIRTAWISVSTNGLSFLLHSLSLYFLDRRNSCLIFLRWVCSPIPQPGAVPNLWIWSLQVLPPLCWVLQLMSSPLGTGSLMVFWLLGLSVG